MTDYQECWYYKGYEGGIGSCMLTEKPSNRVHPCALELNEECYDPIKEENDMDKTCGECGQDIPGLVIAMCVASDETIKLLKVEPWEANRAAARRFANFCFHNAAARFMDEFQAEYKRLQEE